MARKNFIKRIIDCIMLVSLPLLMAYALVGEKAHEWIGVVFLVLFVLHHSLNLHWWTHLGTGFHRVARFINSTVNFLLLADILLLGGSGIMMSRYVFWFLTIAGGMETARNIHMICSYWGFLLMSVHLGLHWNIVIGGTRRILWRSDKAKFIKVLAGTAAGLIAVYGGYAFWKRQIGFYLFLKSPFVFFDYTEPILLFLADYVAIMVLFAAAGMVVNLITR